MNEELAQGFPKLPDHACCTLADRPTKPLITPGPVAALMTMPSSIGMHYTGKHCIGKPFHTSAATYCTSPRYMFAVPGAGVPQEEHTASAASSAELHASLQAAQTSALTQGKPCLAPVASKTNVLHTVLRHKQHGPQLQCLA